MKVLRGLKSGYYPQGRLLFSVLFFIYLPNLFNTLNIRKNGKHAINGMANAVCQSLLFLLLVMWVSAASSEVIKLFRQN